MSQLELVTSLNEAKRGGGWDYAVLLEQHFNPIGSEGATVDINLYI